MKRTLILVLCILPLFAGADVGSLEYTEGAYKSRIHNSKVYQTLGYGLSGTATSFETYFRKPMSLSGYTATPQVTLLACDSKESISIYTCDTTLLATIALRGVAEIPMQLYSFDISVSFDPKKFYVLLFEETPFHGLHQLRGSTVDIFPEGACHNGRNFSSGISPCTNNGEIEDPIVDIPFLLTGVDILPVVLPENPPESAPIIFLPGIFGSKLYQGEEKLWDGLAGEKMRKLVMDENGKSIASVTVGEPLYEFSALNVTLDIYESLREHFDCSGTFRSSLVQSIPGNDTNCGAPLVSYPYDWRYDVFDIVDNGTNYTSGENVSLIDLVEHLANNPTEKVHVVAHSNGGLLAKALMVRLKELGKEELIDTIVLVGSPQLGTPSAVGAMLHGHDQRMGLGFVKRKDVSRTLSLTSPGAYSLLPSQMYIQNNEPLIEFDSSIYSNKYRNAFGQFIDSYGKFVTFLTNSTNTRIHPDEDDLNAPAVLHEKLLQKAHETHKKIDAWSPPEGVAFVQIIGIDNPTVKRYKYSTGIEFKILNIGELKPTPRLKLWHRPVTIEGGDSEVIAEASELGIGDSYYFRLNNLKDSTKRSRDHGTLFAEQEILKTVEEVFRNIPLTSPYLTQTREVDFKENSLVRTIISIHSPVTISVTDSEGNTSSITYDKDSDLFQITEGISDSRIEFIGEAKYVFLPKGAYDVEVTGIDTGSFDLALSQTNENGEIEEVERFKHIPTKDSASAKVSVSEDSFNTLSLDLNNDNINDYTFSLEEDSNLSILNELKESLANLPLRPQLKSAIAQYFELLENTNNEEEKANYVAQIKRIIRFLSERYTTKDTANTWTALAEHLQ